MSYHPSQANISEIPSGIVYFGHSPSDPVYDADSAFTIGGGYLSASNIKISDGGTIGSNTTPNAITIASNGDVSIARNFIVNGTTTTVNSTTLTVADPIIVLGSGSPSTDDNKDRGISFNYYDGTAKTGFFGFDDSAGKFTFIPNATITSEVVTGTVGIIVANLEGNADTATKWITARNIQLIDQVTGSGNIDGSANLSFAVQLTADAVNDQTEAVIANNTDYLLIASGTSLRKVSKANFISGIGAGTMSNFTVSADSGTNQTISDGNTLALIGGSGIITSASNTDTVTININSDNSTLEVNSDILRVKDAGITEVKRSRTIETITTSKTADKDITLVNATSANVTVSLPENATTGRVMIVKRTDASSNDVVIQRTGSDTIDGSTSWQLYYRYETLTFVSDGANWYII